MATLKKTQTPSNSFTPYYCSECRMRQKELRPYCEFCGETLSNYEDVLFELHTERNMREFYGEDKDTEC